MHNFTLSEEQTMILDSVRKLVQDVAEPQALERDEHRQFVADAFGGLAELGLLGVSVPEEAGGAGLGMLSFAVAVEEIAKGCGSTARMFVTQGGYCAKALEGFDAAGEALGEILMGEKIAGFVGPEAGVVASDDASTVTGSADYVTGAGEAAVFVVCAKIGEEHGVFLVSSDAANVQAVEGLGFRAAAPASVHFDGAAATCVARGADAEASIRRASIAGDIGVAALASGVAQSSIQLTKAHAGERIAFGKPLAAQQAVGHKLVESKRRADAARHACFHAARVVDEGEDARDAASMARLTSVDAMLQSADEGIQIHGGYGFTVEYHVERHYRDAKALEVLDGGALALRDALIGSL